MAERTLTQRDLNRALLARQLLLERVRLPIPRAIERMGGIQNQYAPNGYIRLHSCLEGFRRNDLTRALERRSVVQATLMRATIHIVSKRDFWPLAVAVRETQRAWWLRVHRPPPKASELEKAAREIRALLADGPRKHEELAKITGRGWRMVGAVARARPRAAVRHLGAAPRASLPDRRKLGRAREGVAGRRARPARPPVSRRVRPGAGGRRLPIPSARSSWTGPSPAPGTTSEAASRQSRSDG